MVGIYFTTNHMPVRFLIYVALTALTRLLIGMVNLEHVELMEAIQNPHLGLLVVTGGILMLSFCCPGPALRLIQIPFGTPGGARRRRGRHGLTRIAEPAIRSNARVLQVCYT